MRIRAYSLRLAFLVVVGTLLYGCSGNSVAPDSSTAPQISCPVAAPVTVPDGQTSVAVTFGAPVVSGGTAPFTTGCTPPSGISFPIGTTTVTCTTADARQRSASCSFPVLVKPPPLYSINLTHFIAFGDSITAGQDGQNTSALPGRSRPLVFVASPYPALLQSYLSARYTTQSAAGLITVKNDGCPAEALGDPAGPCGPDAYDRMAIDLGAGNYQAILILEGANDLTEYINGDTHALERAYDALTKMVRLAKQRGVRPFLATLPPENPDAHVPTYRGRGAPYVPDFNAQVRLIALSEGADLVEIYNNFDLSLLSGDGLHPTQDGYVRMAQIFFDKLKATLEVSTPSSVSRTLLPAARPSSPARAR